MNKIRIFFIIYLLLSLKIIFADISDNDAFCYTGAFLSDRPVKETIENFKSNFGKKPLLVMIFHDWFSYPDEGVINALKIMECIPVLTLEPWEASTKCGIDYDGLLNGKYDKYIMEFFTRIKKTDKIFYFRFAHEMNGNWYPWSGTKIGYKKYISVYRYMKNLSMKTGIRKLKWIFSVNCDDVPDTEENSAFRYYPGDDCVDFIGLDGYNWGTKESWSRWQSFREIFEKKYNELTEKYSKPVIITEFGTTGKGGNKAEWIKEAMKFIKNKPLIKGFILFNINKETDWKFEALFPEGKSLKEQLQDEYFKDIL